MTICLTCSVEFPRAPLLADLLTRIGPVIGAETRSFPYPHHCPACRRQRRQAFHNERTIYRRNCDLSGRDIVSVFSPDASRKVFHPEVWASDQHDPYEFGRSYDPSRSFFEQLDDLLCDVPRRSVNIINSENCEFNNNIWSSKNSYLVFCASYCQDSSYITNCYKVTNSFDSFFATDLELCHDIFSARRLYECFSCQGCNNSQRLLLCNSCVDCADCIGCFNLRQRQFCIFNAQYTEQDYRKFLSSLNTGSFNAQTAFEARVRAFFQTLPHRDVAIDSISESCSGDMISRSSDVQHSFSTAECEEGIFLFEAARNKSVADLDYTYEATLTYQSCGLSEFYNCAFLVDCDACRDTFYSFSCFNSSNCFGSIGLKRGEYTILNRRYSRDDYERLLSRIIEDMKLSGEWGKFFPPQLADFGYNETDAMLHRPLDREQALAEGWRWNDYEAPPPQVKRTIPAAALPDHINGVDDDILNAAILCEQSGRPFRIINPELAFYRQFQIPLPRLHPEERHSERLRYRNPLALRPYQCAHCNAAGSTTYPEDSASPIVCRSCFELARG